MQELEMRRKQDTHWIHRSRREDEKECKTRFQMGFKLLATKVRDRIKGENQEKEREMRNEDKKIPYTTKKKKSKPGISQKQVLDNLVLGRKVQDKKMIDREIVWSSLLPPSSSPSSSVS